MSIALKPGFQSLATLKLVVNVGKLQTPCGIARFPCDNTAFLLQDITKILSVYAEQLFIEISAIIVAVDNQLNTLHCLEV